MNAPPPPKPVSHPSAFAPLANRAFLGRAVRFLAAQGVTQFLDIGTGIPSPGSTSEVLHDLGHEARVA